MNHINPNKSGSALGALVGGLHFVWSVFVALGWAQPIIDFAFMLHMVKPVFVVEPFSLTRAVALIAVTAVIGYVVGSLFARVWNHLHR